MLLCTIHFVPYFTYTCACMYLSRLWVSTFPVLHPQSFCSRPLITTVSIVVHPMAWLCPPSNWANGWYSSVMRSTCQTLTSMVSAACTCGHCRATCLVLKCTHTCMSNLPMYHLHVYMYLKHGIVNVNIHTMYVYRYPASDLFPTSDS